MFVRIRAAAISCAVLVLLALAAPAAMADLFYNFESGRGHNGESIGSQLSGLRFSDGIGFADITSYWYSFSSDTGSVTMNGEYYMSGNVAAAVLNGAPQARIDFTSGGASYFSVGYSSEFDFSIVGFDQEGNELGSVTGPASVRSNGAWGLKYLTLNCAGMSYVSLCGEPGYWCIDNLSTDAAVPEPSAFVSVAFALSAFGLGRLRSRRVSSAG